MLAVSSPFQIYEVQTLFSKGLRQHFGLKMYKGKDEIMLKRIKKYSSIFRNWEICSRRLSRRHCICVYFDATFQEFPHSIWSMCLWKYLEWMISTNLVDVFLTFWVFWDINLYVIFHKSTQSRAKYPNFDRLRENFNHMRYGL